MEVISRSPEETAAFAAQLANRLRPPVLLLLEGDLGAGKTTFAKGFAAALGIDARNVTSPTYTLMNEYVGENGRLCHCDLYRLQSADDFYATGIEESFAGAYTLVEWPDRLPHEITDEIQTLRLEFAVNPHSDERCITLSEPFQVER
ncbi:tRNA (adenosine(37)-N6)-threonylcarbamoyltransferase complex ATPase subunit type 1 TsaE [Chrysiogenes arsenatis]|uniref:tRNA (adenosine(37)-N6)-threonylcarbamoyltransferase complex ATPase subunit type 1 TsaE n=1 Tax=Chrysiogenes arsenatis TaxID=309797 RepID=UPI0003F54C52|nr:tRNA (adenosine(37)-N6)-threonylcarbamoyltransferase complex ATPase subunit type 1 TsaE [Chrysiogenes arsenatis]